MVDGAQEMVVAISVAMISEATRTFRSPFFGSHLTGLLQLTHLSGPHTQLASKPRIKPM